MNCCFRAEQANRIRVPPGETVELALVLHVADTGPFSVSVDVYLMGEDVRVVPVQVLGRGVADGSYVGTAP